MEVEWEEEFDNLHIYSKSDLNMRSLLAEIKKLAKNNEQKDKHIQ